MKVVNAITLIALGVVSLLTILFVLGGCTVLWTDDAYYCSVLNWKQADVLVVDTNSVDIQAQNYVSDPEKSKLVSPYFIWEAGDED